MRDNAYWWARLPDPSRPQPQALYRAIGIEFAAGTEHGMADRTFFVHRDIHLQGPEAVRDFLSLEIERRAGATPQRFGFRPRWPDDPLPPHDDR